MIPALFFAAAAMACHPVDGDKILGSDLAAALPAFAAIPPDAVAGYSPQPGMRRIFEAGDLARLAATYHLPAPGAISLCLERAAAPPDPGHMQEVMMQTVGDPSAHLEIVAFSQFRVPSGEMVFPRESLGAASSGGEAVWNGYIAYDGGHFPIWARVRLTVKQRRLVAVADLRPGHVLATEDVRVEEVEEFPTRAAVLTRAEDAIGLTPRRVIVAGKPLSATVLEMPNDVDRGQTLVAEARSGAAIVKIEAEAQTGGKRGQTIMLRNPASGKLFRARVEGKGLVVVDCEGLQ